jgi:hypothetical protein
MTMSEPVYSSWRVIALLVAKEGGRADELVARVRTDLGELAQALGSQAAQLVPAIVTGAIGHEASNADGKSDFDLSAEVVLKQRPQAPMLAAALEQFAAGLSDIVSSEHSVVFVGRDVIFDDQRGPLKMMATLTRHPNVSHDDAIHGWMTQAGPNLASHPTSVGYIEEQGDLALTQAALAATGYAGGNPTGVAVEWFRTPEDTLPANEWGMSAKSAELADDPPQSGGIIAVLNRYFDFSGAGKRLFGVEPDPTVS